MTRPGAIQELNAGAIARRAPGPYDPVAPDANDVTGADETSDVGSDVDPVDLNEAALASLNAPGAAPVKLALAAGAEAPVASNHVMAAVGTGSAPALLGPGLHEVIGQRRDDESASTPATAGPGASGTPRSAGAPRGRRAERRSRNHAQRRANAAAKQAPPVRTAPDPRIGAGQRPESQGDQLESSHSSDVAEEVLLNVLDALSRGQAHGPEEPANARQRRERPAALKTHRSTQPQDKRDLQPQVPSDHPIEPVEGTDGLKDGEARRRGPRGRRRNGAAGWVGKTAKQPLSGKLMFSFGGQLLPVR